jgi:hypothetical protein
MRIAARGDRRRALRCLLCLGALAAFLAASAATGAMTGVASADCVSPGGTGCLPGSGYTYDSTPWDCGAINSLDGTYCYANGTLTQGSGVRHSYGWGSAAYNGAGTTTVQIILYNHSSSSGTNLARVCWFASCDDQTTDPIWALVGNFSTGGTRHTVFGHAEA